jgi:hypothetical protein
MVRWIWEELGSPGVLPRQLQMWMMIGLAVIILVIVLFTGHSSPAPRASAATRTTVPSLMPVAANIVVGQRSVGNTTTQPFHARM